MLLWEMEAVPLPSKLRRFGLARPSAYASGPILSLSEARLPSQKLRATRLQPSGSKRLSSRNIVHWGRHFEHLLVHGRRVLGNLPGYLLTKYSAISSSENPQILMYPLAVKGSGCLLAVGVLIVWHEAL